VGVIARVDDYQRRHRWIGLPLAVVYKYVDDQGGYLAALIAYYGFVSLFPMLLLLVTVLGFVLGGASGLQHQALSSAVGQFPIVGEQIGRNIHAVHGSVVAVIIGVVGSLYGGIGVVQATQYALNTVWAVPRNSRPDPLRARLRSLGVLVVLAVGLLATALLSVLTTSIDVDALGGAGGTVVRVGAVVLAVLLDAALFTVVSRLLLARQVSVRQIGVGALVAAVGWQVLQLGGSYLVGHELRGADASYGVFGVVLGLIAFLYLAATLVVLCAELTVIRVEKLWPRSLLTPFTDKVRLTEPDRRAYTSYATAQRAKGFEQISAEFQAPDAAHGPDGDTSTGGDRPDSPA
jgi:inner membrane protein YhjD